MSHPYKTVPAYARWSSAIRRITPVEVDPVVGFPFRLTAEDRIITAGSCFAQHIARYLTASGFNHHIVEPGHPVLPGSVRAAHNYGLFSARYGNIYTARQLLQLFRRALGLFVPAEPPWRQGEAWLDPLRPTVQPGGFISVAELQCDQAQHLKAVRRAMGEMQYFVFTLGLTEAWECTADGTVLPLCPGVEGGVFDPEAYRFVNFGLAEVVADLTEALELLRSVNPAVRIILTVSPVPLAATAVDRHVLVSTTLSKAILRLAAEEVVTRLSDVAYFPSYEIITGSFNRGGYFAKDLREVTEEGVGHVMRLFFRHAAGIELAAVTTTPPVEEELDAEGVAAEVLCEERLLDMGPDEAIDASLPAAKDA